MFDSHEVFKKHLESAIQSNENTAFFLLSGLKGTGKSLFVQELSRDILGDYFTNDFLYIKDFSDQLQKQHNIRVEQQNNEQSSLLLRDFSYQDLGIREINTWLQHSPAGKIKILLLENIERMTLNAANAFLKTCEEPLANRIIVATTANKSTLLPTVLSRSILIPFDSDDMKISSDQLLELKKLFQILSSSDNIYKKHQFLLELKKSWPTDMLLDQIILQYSNDKNFMQAQKRLKVKKMSQRNVSIDNLLFYGLLD